MQSVQFWLVIQRVFHHRTFRKRFIMIRTVDN